MAFLESFGGQALLSGISTAMNWLQQGHSISAQKDAQKELMDHQFELNQRQWAAENDYNSPLSQMTRLKSAGLNPNLVYGSGAVTGNTTTQGPRAQYTHVDRNQAKFENLANIVERVQQIKSMRANVSAQEKLADLYGQQAANAVIQGELMNMEKTKRGFENMLLEQTIPYSIEYSKLRNQEIMRNMDFTLKRMGLTDAQIDQIKSGIFKLDAETENIKERTNTQRYQNKYWWSKGLNPNANPALTALANLPDLLREGVENGNLVGITWGDIPDFEKSRVEGMYSRATRNSRQLFGKEMSVVRRLFLSMLAAMQDASESHQFIGR